MSRRHKTHDVIRRKLPSDRVTVDGGEAFLLLRNGGSNFSKLGRAWLVEVGVADPLHDAGVAHDAPQIAVRTVPAEHLVHDDSKGVHVALLGALELWRRYGHYPVLK